jgi:hypothetical protein
VLAAGRQLEMGIRAGQAQEDAVVAVVVGEAAISGRPMPSR